MAKCLCAHKNMCIRYINTQKPNIQSKNEVIWKSTKKVLRGLNEFEII